MFYFSLGPMFLDAYLRDWGLGTGDWGLGTDSLWHFNCKPSWQNCCTINQGCSQTSEKDEASFEPLGGVLGHVPPPLNILKSRGSEMLSFKHFPWHFSSDKSILGQNQDEAIASSCLMLAMALSTSKYTKENFKIYILWIMDNIG